MGAFLQHLVDQGLEVAARCGEAFSEYVPYRWNRHDREFELEDSGRQRDCIQRRAQIMRYEGEVLVPTPSALRGPAPSQTSESPIRWPRRRRDSKCEKPFPLELRPLLSAMSWMHPRRMLYSAATSTMSKPFSYRSSPWIGGLPSSSASGIALVLYATKCGRQLVQQSGNVIVEGGSIQVLRGWKLSHLYLSTAQARLALALDKRRQSIKILSIHYARLKLPNERRPRRGIAESLSPRVRGFRS